MPKARLACKTIPHGNAGFGLIDALVALTLLAVTLLGACGSLQFAMRATRAAAWQAQAVDLVADLNEDLQGADAAEPMAAMVEPWRTRLQQDLPAARIAALNPRSLAVGESGTGWFDLQLSWNAMPGQPRQTLRLPLAHAAMP